MPETISEHQEIRAMLREFYGRAIQKTDDLETNACCDVNTMQLHSEVVKLIPERAKEKYLGCGSPLPDDLATLRGLTALDLGSGTGVDAMILRSYLGPEGAMIGVDMTDEQLSIAREAGAEFMDKLGYAPASLRFERDFIETLDCIEDNSVDLVISNCVINLSPRQELVFEAIRRVRKPGGELFISDIVADRRHDLQDDEILVAECLGMAPYVHDARDMINDAGFADVRIHSTRRLADNQRVLDRGDAVKFYSVIWRGWKLETLDRRCEDYGQMATYRGNLANSPTFFRLDEEHLFENGRPTHVCRNTARMLGESRLGRYFDVTEPIKHFGLFPECTTPAQAATGESGSVFACC